MNTPVSVPRRRIWPWVLGILLAPFVLLGIAAASYLTLDRDASALRRNIMRASDADWNTKVQFSVGRISLGCVRTGLGFLPDGREKIQEARQALRALRNASVGVYELQDPAEWSAGNAFAETDKTMRNRGFTRVVGVSKPRETVMIYIDEDADEGDPIDICIAVVDGRQLVVASATIDADAIAEFIDTHVADRIQERLRTRMHL